MTTQLDRFDEMTQQEKMELFNDLPDVVKLNLLYKHNAGFREEIEMATWHSQREQKVTESKRLLEMDITSKSAYGFRIRCRVCLAEGQANLPHHAEQFISQHNDCYESAKPRL